MRDESTDDKNNLNPNIKNNREMINKNKMRVKNKLRSESPIIKTSKDDFV